MFRLVEAANTDPVRFPIKPGAKLTPGCVIKITEYEGNQVADLCDGYSPLGILGNRCVGGNTIDFMRSANIFLQRMVADVGKFDRRNKVGVGTSLYCSRRGVLSSKKPFEGSIVLAKVITPANKEKKHMQILWL